MTIADIRKFVRKEYKIGQKVTLKLNDCDRYGGDKITVVIIGFYSESVLTERNGFRESFRYWDFMRMALTTTEEKVKNEKTGQHKKRAAS